MTYPFLSYTIKTEQSHRDALTEKELEKLEHYREQLKEPNETLNAFLLVVIPDYVIRTCAYLPNRIYVL